MIDIFFYSQSDNFTEALQAAAEGSTTKLFWFIDSDSQIDDLDLWWRPPPWEEHQLQVFGSRWQRNAGVYLVNKYTYKNLEYNYRTEQVVKRKANLGQWDIPINIDTSKFDFSWHPDFTEPPYEYHFPTQWQTSGGPRYRGTAGIKLCGDQRATAIPDLQRWWIPENAVTETFDFSWHPPALEPAYEHHFPSQWQMTGGPIYNYGRGLPAKFHETPRIRVTNNTPIFYVDFMNPGSETILNRIKSVEKDVKSTRFVDSYINVLKRIANQTTADYVWVVSSLCDYSQFDFSWHPDSHQQEMIHCFGSTYKEILPDYQERGDTFYINVNSFRRQMYDLEILDWFKVINYCEDQKYDVIRMYEPVIRIGPGEDTIVNAVLNHEFTHPYTIFKTENNTIVPNRPPCVWNPESRVAYSLSASGSTSLIPRDIKPWLKTQIYDYPMTNKDIGRSRYTQLMDIIYISNGEPEAERWYQHLREVVTKQCRPAEKRLSRVQNVNGRTAAYHAAAKTSTTPWFFAVFAKQEVVADFNFDWQPDYWQQPKHYIFNAKNPVNALEYGHMGIIAYNKKLVLATTESGLDFTLSQPHESVPILSAIAHFNADPWMTWRTAFREVIKLLHFDKTAPTPETTARLNTWLTRAEGLNAEWCLQGARDAVEYYQLVDGDYSKLMLSFDWAWLRDFAVKMDHKF